MWHDRFKEFFFGPPSVASAWKKRMAKFAEINPYETVTPEKGELNDLALVHDRSLIEKLLEFNEVGGYLDPDTLAYPGFLDDLLLIVGAGKKALELALREGRGYNPYGGLHHAGRNRTGGFCPANDLAVIAEMASKRLGKVAVVDFDAHHGNGTQEIFYRRRDVLTISVHLRAPWFYPGTGDLEEVGEGEGYGYNINFPLPPGTGDEAYKIVIEMIESILEKYKPNVVLVQMGVDGHYSDPLGGALGISMWTFKRIGEFLANLKVPTVGFGGGGYGEEAAKRMLVQLKAWNEEEVEVEEEMLLSPSRALERVREIESFLRSLGWL